jgi:hypothetical protein
VSRWAPKAGEAATRLQRVESLLVQALDDLSGKGSAAPCSRCAVVLTEASAELQIFAGLVTEPDRAALRPQLQALLPRLSTAERLLAAAAEFYRGWCAAAPQPSYPAPCYHGDGLSHGPALLALEG